MVRNKWGWYFLAAVFALVLASCKPYDKPEFVEIGSNETAFVVPMTGKTSDQAAFMSEDFLRKNMVATKRIQIPHEWVQTGKISSKGEWIDTIMVIKVDRTPVSETYAPGSAQKASVESRESVGFTIPISITAMIDEADAPKFLNKYTANKSLRDVVNTDINAFVRTNASKAFGSLTLEQCKQQKTVILDKIYVDTQAFFKQFGISITQFGMTDGFYYDDEKYQNAINAGAALEAENRNLTQREANAKLQRGIDLKNAENEAAIAATKASSVNALKALQEVENSRIRALAEAEAIKIAAQSVDLPDVLPEGLFMQLGLDKYVPSAKK